MQVTYCESCGSEHHWSWDEAFYKFGFGDGDGLVETYTVADVLKEAGYAVIATKWGLHNVVITSIKKGDQELIPYDNPDYQFGYDCARDHFPKEIIDLLDEKLP